MNLLRDCQFNWRKCALLLVFLLVGCGLIGADDFDVKKCIQWNDSASKWLAHGNCPAEFVVMLDVATGKAAAGYASVKLGVSGYNKKDVKTDMRVLYKFGSCVLDIKVTKGDDGKPVFTPLHQDAGTQVSYRLPFFINLDSRSMWTKGDGRAGRPIEVASFVCKPFEEDQPGRAIVVFEQHVPVDSNILLVFDDGVDVKIDEKTVITFPPPTGASTGSPSTISDTTITPSESTHPESTHPESTHPESTYQESTHPESTPSESTPSESSDSGSSTTPSTSSSTPSPSTPSFSTIKPTKKPKVKRPKKSAKGLGLPAIIGIVSALLLLVIAVGCSVGCICLRRLKTKRRREEEERIELRHREIAEYQDKLKNANNKPGAAGSIDQLDPNHFKHSGPLKIKMEEPDLAATGQDNDDLSTLPKDKKFVWGDENLVYDIGSEVEEFYDKTGKKVKTPTRSPNVQAKRPAIQQKEAQNLRAIRED